MASDLTLQAPPGAVIRVTARSGSVTVTGEDRSDVVVTGAREAKVKDDGSIEVKSRSGSVSVRCPDGSDVIIGANSGRVELRGRLGDARVTVGSGSVVVDHVERLDARTGSGSFEIAECAGECRLKTGSGRIKVAQSGDADLATGSGAVAADRVDGAKVKAGSGNVEVGLVGSGRLDVKALSGDARVVKDLGDGLMLWFPEPVSALGSCLALAERFEEEAATDVPLWVRVGMHWGCPARRGADLVGHDVNLAARIVDVAGPGEVLLSEPVRELVDGRVQGLRLDELGPVVMKGIPDAVPLYRAALD